MGHENLTVTQAAENIVEAFERVILRRILGPLSGGEEGWRSSYNGVIGRL